MTSSWQMEMKMKAKKNVRPANELNLSYYEIWPVDRLRALRFS